MKRMIMWSAVFGFSLACLLSVSFADEVVHGTYINKLSSKEYLTLNPDGTFFLKQRNRISDLSTPFISIEGKYDLKGDDLILKLPDGGEAKGKLQGNAFVDTQGVPWLKGSEGPLFDREVRKKIRR
ncbi:MAG: hypothetical protein HPY84_03330 [Syntrophobacteraceae bacterium]|nr:hypothetical protein [Syntrophobacteraceae bacterium]